jgi:Cu/Ag efflux pump CusA
MLLRSILETSLKFKLLIISISAVFLFIGVSNLPRLALDVVPEFSPPYVEVQTEALGLSAEEVEQLITVPLEADLLNGVAWLKTIHSSSIPGLSSIVLIFEPGTDVVKARQMVQERLTLAHGIPQVSKPPVMLQPLSSTSRVMQVGLTSEDLNKVSHIDMSVLAYWTVKPRLMGVPGVANVSIWGLRKRQLQVLVDPAVLKTKGVTLNNIIKTTGESLWVSPLSFLQASSPGTGGWIDTPNQRLGVRHVSPINSAYQLAQVPLHGKSMPLSEVADVVENHQLLIGDSIVNDGPGLLLVIEKFPWANTLQVTRGVEKALETLKPGLSGIDVDSTIFRPATFIEDARNNILYVLLISFGLLAVTLFVVLLNWRASIVSLITIPTSLVMVILIFYWQGITINSMVFTGLIVALVVLIDDAIIDAKNIARKSREPRSDSNLGKSVFGAIIDGALSPRGSMVYATLILALAVAPAIFMKDLLGTFLQPMVMSFLLAILISTAVALLLTPALSLMLAGRGSTPFKETKMSPFMKWLYNRQHGFVSIIAAFAVVSIGLISWKQLEYSLLPRFKENTLLVKLEGTPSTSRLAMNRIVTNIGRELHALPGVENVSAHVGRAVMSDEIVNVNSSQLWVSLTKAANYDTTLRQIQTVIDSYPGLDGDVLTYIQAKIEDFHPEAGEDLAVRVYGANSEVLETKAEEIKATLAKIEGVEDASIDLPLKEPTLEIKVDLERAKNFGIKPGDVRRAATTLLSGIEVGSLFEEQKVFDVVVWGKPEIRQNVTNVQNLLIDTPHGGYVRLDEVADVKIVPAQTVIKRESVSRHIDIDVSVEGRDLSAVLAEVDANLKKIVFPLDYHAEILGEHAERRESLRSVRDYAIAAAIGIFLLLQAAFRSWVLASIVFMTILVSLAGGLIAGQLTGGVFSLGSIAGLLATFALSTRFAVALVRHVQAGGPQIDASQIRDRMAEQFQSIASTLIVSAVALTPFALLGQGGPGLEIIQPMAIVSLGGLATTAFVNLYLLPNLILMFWRPESNEDSVVGVS